MADSVDPVLDQQGGLTGAVHIIRDITERKQVERLLRKERDRAQKYLDVAGVMLVAIDAEQRVGLINKKGCEILGYSEEEVIAKNWFDNFLPKRIKEEVKGVFNKLLCGEADAPEYYENLILTKNGQERLIAWHNTVLRDDKGKVIAALGSGEDITERRRAEEALRESEEKYRGLVENSPNLVAIYQEGTLKYVNQIMCEKLGWTFQEMTSPSFNPVEKIIPQRFQSLIRKNIAKRLRRENISPYEVSIKTRDGSEIPVIVNAQAILYQGKPADEVIHIDITERKRAEEALRESEEKYKDLFENAREAIITVDLNGNIADVNKLAEEYGFKREELKGKKYLDFTSERFKAKAVKEFARLVQGYPVQGEMEVITPAGIRTVEYRDNPILRAGKVVGIQAILTDITERKKTEEALQHSEEYFRAITENSSDIIIIVDKKGTILYVSSSIERFSGYKPEELIGKSAFDFIHPDDFPRAVNDFSKTIQTKDVAVPNSFRVRHKDGSEFVLEGVGKNLLDNPVIKGFVMNVRDVTERKKAEQVLKASEKKYRTLIENVPQKIFLKDKDSVYVSCNENYARDLKIKHEEITDKTDYDFYPEELAEKYRADDKRIMQSGKIEDIEEKYIQDGKEFWVHTVKTPVKDDKGNIIGVLGVFRNITEQKKAEQQLLEDQAQLKSLASELTLAEEHERRRLATELHDRISQSLVISKIKLDALRKSGRSRKLDKALEDVCNSIGQTIQDIRTLTFDLSSPVLYELGFETAVSEWLTDQIQEKHGLAVEFEDDKLPKPLADDIRIFLFRDVRELLINIVKHANAHKVKVSIKKLGNQICVTVEDDGVGFDPAQVASTAAKKGEFGLFSIRERLEGLGGHIQIDSAPGRGCKVTMTAPLKQKEMTQ